MDTWVGHQVGLELCQVDVESAVESERSRDGRYDLANQPVKIGVGGTLNVQVPAADVVDSLVVNHERTVRVLQGGMGGQDRVVGFDHSCGHLRGRVDSELQFGLLAVVNGESLHEERSEPRSGASSERVEDEEALETGALVSQLTDAVED